MGLERGKEENKPFTEANILQCSESSNSPSLIRYISLSFGGLDDRVQPGTLFHTKKKRCSGYTSIKQAHLTLTTSTFKNQN